MALLTEAEQRRISEAIAEAERHTNAELVTVLAAQSDEYRYIPVIWALVAALLIPSVLYVLAVPVEWIIVGQLGTFVVLAPLLQINAIRTQLIPKGVREWRASNMARRQFLERNLHHTDGDTGVLIFVSEAEHYVEILADRGISAQVDDGRWAEIVAAFVDDVRAHRVEAGFVRAIEACGKILAGVVPKTPDNHNELDDRLIVIGYD